MTKYHYNIIKLIAPHFFLLAILSTYTLSSQADTVIYKWTDKNGVISYSQTMPQSSNQQNINRIILKDLPPTAQEAAKRMLFNLKASDDAFKTKENLLKLADNQIDDAIQQLRNAEKNLREGSIPDQNDREITIYGVARLRDSYFYRVNTLQQEVEIAKKKLNDAYAAREALYPTQ